MGCSLRHSLYLLVVVAGLTFAAGAVFAQAAPSVVPVNISPVGPAPGGLQTMATYSATGAGAANGYYSRPVLVSRNTLGGLANGLLRRAAPVAAMVALVEAAGWAIDELSKQVMGPAVGTPPPAPGTGVYCTSQWGSSYSGRMCGPSPESFIGKSTGWPGGTYTVTGATPTLLIVNNGQVGGASISFQAYPVNDPWLDYTPATPVPLADLGQLVEQNPSVWNDALRNPDGSVNRNPDVMAEAQALAQELAAANPLPDPAAEWDTGQQGGDPQQAPASDFPAFCSWAAKVCELADWLMDDGDEEPAPVDLPVIEPDTAVTWNSGLGGGSCPADIAVGNVMGAELVFPLSGFCLAADIIRPLVLAAAALLALLIVGGFRHAS